MVAYVAGGVVAAVYGKAFGFFYIFFSAGYLVAWFDVAGVLFVVSVVVVSEDED